MPNGRWRVPLGIPKLFGIVRPGKSTESKLTKIVKVENHAKGASQFCMAETHPVFGDSRR